MNAVGNLAMPHRGSPNLARAPIAFNNQQIPGLNSKSLKLSVEKFYFMNFFQM
jgi:hypothetical protein